MGCSGSKLEAQEALSLCRNRTEFISAAIRHRYAVADAHSAYSSSLISVADSLHKFLNLASSITGNVSEISLPPQRKGESFAPSMPSSGNNNVGSTSAAAAAGHSHSNSEAGSGGHIEFHSSDSDHVDSDDEDDRSETTSHSHLHPEIPGPPHIYNNYQPYHNYNTDYDSQQQNFGLGSSFMNFHYAKNEPPPPTVHFFDPSSSQSINYNDYGNGYSNSYPYDHPSYGYFGNSSSPLASSRFGNHPGENSSVNQKPPPPPPSPPRVSNWEFLNPFELQENYYPTYTPSRSSRDVRDEEGIPELEDENLEHEVVKEVYGDQKFVGSSSKSYNKNGYIDDGGVGASLNPKSSNVVESEDDVVEKNVVADEVPHPQMDMNAASTSRPRSYHNVMEIGSEIRIQFEKASEAALEISKLLEVGKQPYRFRKNSVMEVSSRIICVMPPSASDGEELLSLEEDIETSSKNISSTLHKLYIWEKKLQDEVRLEEKMRLLLDKNRKRQRYLAERGAEQNKIGDVQKLIKKLSTKIRIAIQVIDSISNTINKIRDDELWPQIGELINGLMKMWKAMLECHQTQTQAISEAKNLDSISSSQKFNDGHLNVVFNLERDVLKWTDSFSSWITAQKSFVKSLNAWLTLCLNYEPEITADGVAPYSPGRIGAPPIFVICNSWAQVIDMISEVDVINAMRGFIAILRNIWEKNGLDPNHKVMPSGDMDRLIKARERDAQVIHKEIDALNKKLELVVPGQYDHSDSDASVKSLQLCLKHVFETMEVFTAKSLKAYEELQLRSEEEKVASETAKLSG